MVKCGGAGWARGAWAWALLLVWAPCAAVGQAPRTGTVVDRSGTGVPGATLVVAEDTSGRPTVVTADLDGRFVLPGAPAAALAVRVEKHGFAPQRLTVAPGNAPVRIVLDVALTSEPVTVVPPLVDTTTFDAFGAATAIVSDAQIEQLDARDLASALRRTPGVTISRFNPIGAFGGEAGGAVFVRGLGASRPGSEIKTYVDGVPFYMGIWSHPLLDLLPVSALERVQVHKGPQPHAFGNAFSAIDLATRRPAGAGLDGALRVSAGAFATLAEQAEVSGVLGRWEFAATQGFARSDGHREAADGRLASAFGRLGYHWTRRWSVVATALVADNTARDPGVAGEPDSRTGRFATAGTLVSVALAHDHARARGSLQVYANRGEGDWRGQPAPDGDTRTRFALSGARWREEVSWLGATLSGGLDLDRVGGSVQFDRVAPAPRTRWAADTLTLTSPHVAAHRVVALGQRWSLQPSAGLRGYAHSVFGGEVAPHAGLVVRAPAGLAARARYARGISYPGQEVVALAGLIPPLRDTWRTLRAESAAHVEVGATFTPSASTLLDVAWFRDRVSDRYVFAFPPVVAAPTFANLGAFRVRGMEASVRQRLAARWQTFLGLTLLDGSDPSLPYVPARSLVAGVTGGVGALRIAADLQHQSSMRVLARSRSAGGANTSRVDGFTVVNVRPSWAVPASGGRVELFLAIENLFDEAYAYRPGYPMPGASAQVGVTVRGRTR